MEDTRTLAGSDDAERQRIRQALRRYMSEQRIGVPALRARIIKEDRPRHREIPLSTLQRFLAGSHQTQDMYVSVCRDFAAKLPWYGEESALAHLGDGLAAFFNLQAAEPAPPSAAVLAGEFEGALPHALSFAGEDLAGGIRLSFESLDPASRLTVLPVPGKTWAQVREIVFDRQAQSERRELFEGVILRLGDIHYALMRSSLTRRPKGYGLVSIQMLLDHREDLAYRAISLVPVVPARAFDLPLGAGRDLVFSPAMEGTWP